jgi:TetR/AcrR family transcriptional repressor of nem operon
MRYSSTHKEETHERIVKTAAKSFRRHGINGIGVVPLMKETGLTHGGFYSHFKSKDGLIGEAIDAAFQQTLAKLRQATDAAPPGQRRRAFIKEYITAAHRDNPAEGCAIAALGTETARLKPSVRQHFDKQFEATLKLMEDSKNSPSRDEAIRTCATAIGALVMARTVRSKELSDEILEAARKMP